MKDLSIEEKAKRYDEALEIAKEINNEQRAQPFYVMTRVFPELKESEDERIINNIKKVIVWYRGMFTEKSIMPEEYQEINAWLEKQSKKVEPIESFNSEFERQISHLIASIINKEHEYNEGYVKWTANALLEYAKRELEKQAGRKSSWSEEEEKNIERIIDTILCAKSIKNGIPKALYTDEILDELVDWLKSLKDKVQPQSQWKPSDEQIQALVYVFNHYIPNATDKIAWNALQTIELMLGQLLREE